VQKTGKFQSDKEPGEAQKEQIYKNINGDKSY
jgi:hypothetical protein